MSVSMLRGTKKLLVRSIFRKTVQNGAVTAKCELTIAKSAIPASRGLPLSSAFSSRFFSTKADASGDAEKDAKDEITQEEINSWFDHPDVDNPNEYYNWEDPFISIVKSRQEADGLRVLNLHERVKRKTSLNHRMRAKQKMIPGVIYGTDENNMVYKSMISVCQKSIAREMREIGVSIENKIYKIHVYPALPPPPEGGRQVEKGNEEESSKYDEHNRLHTHYVLPRQIQIDPLTDKPISVNFIKYRPGLRLRFPLQFINEDQSAALKRNCFLLRVNKFIECFCDIDIAQLPGSEESAIAKIPKRLSVDLTGLEKDDAVRMDRIHFPDGIRPHHKVPSNFVVAVVKNK